MDKHYIIQDFPNDVYRAVGEITRYSQELERDYKILAEKLSLDVKNIGKSSLNKLNDALKKHNLITKKEYNDLKQVIKIRNHINHNFFLNDFEFDFENENKNLEAFLNTAIILIFEATDVINNKIDKLNGDNIMRRTVFDE